MAEFAALLTGIHPLQADHDVPVEALMHARIDAALAWGGLQGLVAHLDGTIARVFAASLIRAQLVDALRQVGHAEPATHFDRWFCGLQPAFRSGPHVFAPAWVLAAAVLAELANARFEPLARAAQQLRAAATVEFARAGPSLTLRQTIDAAADLAASATAANPRAWPLAAADCLHARAAASADFAPVEPERQWRDTPAGRIGFEPPRPAAPLWAIDLAAGAALARGVAHATPLPCPGLIRAEALAPWLWPNERGILVAEALTRCAERLTTLLAEARTQVDYMAQRLRGVRSTSRAPELYMLLAGFGPLRPHQIEHACRVSKNGARELVKTLGEAKLAIAERHGTQVLIRASGPVEEQTSPSLAASPLPALSPASLAEFDSAIADIDRLLARSGNGEDQTETADPSR